MEDDIKGQIGKIIIFCIFGVIFLSVVVNAYKQKSVEEAFKKADLECAGLSQNLEKENKTCSCWYSDCKTTDDYVNQKTQNFCMCECFENNTIVSLCLRRTI